MRLSFSNLQRIAMFHNLNISLLERIAMFHNLNISLLEQIFKKIRNSTRAKLTKLQLISAFVVDHVKGFIYVEAERQNDINHVALVIGF